MGSDRWSETELRNEIRSNRTVKRVPKHLSAADLAKSHGIYEETEGLDSVLDSTLSGGIAAVEETRDAFGHAAEGAFGTNDAPGSWEESRREYDPDSAMGSDRVRWGSERQRSRPASDPGSGAVAVRLDSVGRRLLAKLRKEEEADAAAVESHRRRGALEAASRRVVARIERARSAQAVIGALSGKGNGAITSDLAGTLPVLSAAVRRIGGFVEELPTELQAPFAAQPALKRIVRQLVAQMVVHTLTTEEERAAALESRRRAMLSQAGVGAPVAAESQLGSLPGAAGVGADLARGHSGKPVNASTIPSGADRGEQAATEAVAAETAAGAAGLLAAAARLGASPAAAGEHTADLGGFDASHRPDTAPAWAAQLPAREAAALLPAILRLETEAAAMVPALIGACRPFAQLELEELEGLVCAAEAGGAGIVAEVVAAYGPELKASVQAAGLRMAPLWDGLSDC